MALELKYDVQESTDRLSINVIDQTRSYSTGNPGGWGVPNPVIASAIASRIIIKKKGGAAYTVDVYPDLPTTDNSLLYNIPATSFGFSSGEKITDGLYEVKYEVDYSVGQATQTVSDSFYFAFIEGLKCCLANIKNDLPVPSSMPCEPCMDEKVTTVTNMSTLLSAVCLATECDQLDRAQALIDYIQRYCDCNCSEC